jgi:hypothetical protein
MGPLIWLAITASGLLFGQLQNFGTPAPDPEEKKRAERALSQGETAISQNERMLKQNRTAIHIAIVALGVSVISVLISLIAIFWRR